MSTLNAGETVEFLDFLLDRGEPAVIAFLNANLSNFAADDPKLAESLRRAFVLNDGIGVDLASRLLHGEAFPDNLNGTDFVPRYFSATRQRLKIFLLGGARESTMGALRAFRTRFPRHEFIGARDGYFGRNELPEVIEYIAAAKPDIVLIGLGNPAQELFATRHIEQLGCKLAFCTGGLIDFVSGRAQRAPEWVRAIRCEWLYRLWREPARLWRRYLLGSPRFVFRVLRETLRTRKA